MRRSSKQAATESCCGTWARGGISASTSSASSWMSSSRSTKPAGKIQETSSPSPTLIETNDGQPSWMPTNVNSVFLTKPMSCQYSRVLQHIYAPQKCQGTSAQGIDCLRGSATFRVKAGPQAVEASEAPSKSLASVVLFLEELRGRLQGPQGHMAETRLLSRLLWFLSEIEINYVYIYMYIYIRLMSNTKNLLYNYYMYI